MTKSNDTFQSKSYTHTPPPRLHDPDCSVLFLETIPASVYVIFTGSCSLITLQSFPTLHLPQPMLEILALPKHSLPNPFLSSSFKYLGKFACADMTKVFLSIFLPCFRLIHLTIKDITIKGISKSGD